MWSKRNKNLLIILAVLLVILGVDEAMSVRQSKKSFKDILITADSSQIAYVEFYPKNNTEKKIILQRKDNKWYVTSQKGTFDADMDKVREILETLTDLRPEQVMGNSKKTWETYGVTDTSALNVIVKNKRGKEIAHLYLGQIRAEGQNAPGSQQKLATYIRMKGDNNVYMVPHLLALKFINDPDEYRNNNLTPTFSPDITRVDIELPDTSFTISKTGGRWYFGNEKADSLNCERYARLLGKVESTQFASDSEITNLKPIASLTIHYADSSKIDIKGYGDTTIRYVWSSYNPNTYFKANILKNRLFKKPEFFKYKEKQD